MNEARFCWLVSYPRSGNTWLRLLLSSLVYPDIPLDINAIKLSAVSANRWEFDEYLGIDSSELSEAEIEAARPALCRALIAESADRHMFRKVHDRFWRTERGEAAFPGAISLGAVYVVRDPRDVAPSLSAFKGYTIDQTIDFMNDPDAAFADSRIQPGVQLHQPTGAWSEHVCSWLDQTEVPVHVLRYEDLLADTAGRLADVAAFFGLEAGRAVAAAERVTFSALQEQEARDGFRENRKEGGREFFRNGRAGSGRECLDDTHRRRLEEAHGDTMRRLGYL